MGAEEGSNFLRNGDLICEGDTVVIYVNPSNQYSVVVKRGQTLHMKYGALRHEFLIGKRYGTAISATAGYVYALRVNPNLWTRTLTKKTQILYTPDISAILLLLDVRVGSKICETGTGSGSLSHAFATIVAESGHLFSYDINESRVKAVQNDLKQHGLAQCATVELRDVCQDGFSVEDCCDGVFLDLPAPWLAIGHAKKALRMDSTGRLVSFSPCIEQVQQVCAELERQGFVEIETVELVPQKLKVCDTASENLFEFAANGSNAPPVLQQMVSVPHGTKRKLSDKNDIKKDDEFHCASLLNTIPYPICQPTHTGYITSATLLPFSSLISSKNCVSIAESSIAESSQQH